MTHAGSIALNDSFFREGNLPAFLGGVNCTGDETLITDCPRVVRPSESMCGRYQDAGVVCQCEMHTINSAELG